MFWCVTLHFSLLRLRDNYKEESALLFTGLRYHDIIAAKENELAHNICKTL